MSILNKFGSKRGDIDRRALGREVANLFFAAEKRGFESGQIDSFGDILCRLLSDLTLPEQTDVSERMSKSENAPHDLVATMAKSQIAVATPVLENSRILTEDDLVEISNTLDTEHRLAVSRRKDLTSRVTDSLIGFEEGEVMRSVVANETAEISESGFTTLARHGSDDAELLNLLMQRADLPEATAGTILPFLDAAGRDKLMRLMAENGKAFDDMVAKAKVETSTKKISASKGRIEAKAMAKAVEAGERTLDEVVLKLAQEMRAKDMAVVFSEVSLLPESKTFNAIMDMDGDLLALMCSAFELPFPVYKACDLMRRHLLNLPSPSDWDSAHERYDGIVPETARKTLRFVNVMAHVG